MATKNTKKKTTIQGAGESTESMEAPRVHQSASDKKMPPGKMQFGIIVRKEIHTKAKHLAADMDLKISDVYAAGVIRLADAARRGGNPEVEIAARELLDGVPQDQWRYLKAVANMLRSNPERYALEMLDAILAKYFPGAQVKTHEQLARRA